MFKTWEGYRYRDDIGVCQYCCQPMVLVWHVSGERSRAEEGWTECGGVGEGSCNFRAGSCACCEEEGFEPEALDPETGFCEVCQAKSDSDSLHNGVRCLS